MRLGIESDSLNKGSYGRFGENVYKKLAALGYAASDFNSADTDTELYTLPFEEVEAILLKEKALAAEAGILIDQVHGPWRWPCRDFTEEDRAERMEKMKKSIRIAAVLGSENWVVHPIMPFGVEEAETPDAEKTWELNVVFMRELLEEAKKYGITICLENMPMLDFSLAKPEMILKLVEEINDPLFRICLDTGHVSVFDDLDLAEETRRLGKYIRVTHIHDNKQNRDLHLFPMFGRLDWPSFAKALKDIEYDGVFLLEVNPPKTLPDELFEEAGVTLSKIARHITAEI